MQGFREGRVIVLAGVFGISFSLYGSARADLNGTFSFAIKTSSSDKLDYSSKEGSMAAELVVGE